MRILPRAARALDGARRPRRADFRPRAEALEGRELLAVGYDPTFGGGAPVDLARLLDLPIDSSLVASAAAAQADGKTVVVGYFSTVRFGGYNTSALFAIRLNEDGSLDKTFGNGGLATPLASDSRYLNRAQGVAILPDGKILIGGTTDYSSTRPEQLSNLSDLLVTRLNADGSLDTSFDPAETAGGLGFVNINTGLYDDFAGMGVAADGSIVVVGTSMLRNYDYRVTNYAYPEVVVARLRPDGSLDTSFDGDGVRLIDAGATPTRQVAEQAAGVAVQADGKIVIAATRTVSDGTGSTIVPADFLVIRLDATGALDAGFGTGGETTVGFDLGGDLADTAGGVALRPDGTIVVVGTAALADGVGLAAARLTTGGVLDPTFDGDGKAIVTYADSGETWRAASAHVVALLDGSILIGGTANRGTTTEARGLLARLAADGSPAADMGPGGVAVVGAVIDAFTVRPDGKVVLVGGTVGRTTSLGPDLVPPIPVPPPVPPDVAGAMALVAGRGRAVRLRGVAITFSAALAPGPVVRQGTFRVRLGTKGGRFLATRRATYDAATHTATVRLVRPMALAKRQVVQVLIASARVVSLDGLHLAGGDRFVTADRP